MAKLKHTNYSIYFNFQIIDFVIFEKLRCAYILFVV